MPTLTLLQLTTEHAASSYGQPVLLLDGNALGPADTIQIAATTVTAQDLVRAIADVAPHAANHDLVQTFLREDW